MKLAMELFKRMITKIILLLLLPAICHGCSDENVSIEPIGDSGRYKMGNDEFQYYTVANYKNCSPDSLLKILCNFCRQKHLTKSVAQNDFVSIFFYEKTLFADYQEHISDAIRSETGSIDKYSRNLIAKIYYLKIAHDKNVVLTKIIYNKDSIILLKRDTLEMFRDDDRALENKWDEALWNENGAYAPPVSGNTPGGELPANLYIFEKGKTPIPTR
ncbi:hypothetical protein [Coprobacter tertius]|uniref:Lipoprotein n=1 Tax=Coprobacter tertius TaxID=2944915 RepID=A0ABT1MEN5_9BACT|nr:hypothetical protein [Coprobacter tertius]MCP9611088.1 hypothetical protein [Coprobacter tertius]